MLKRLSAVVEQPLKDYDGAFPCIALHILTKFLSIFSFCIVGNKKKLVDGMLLYSGAYM